MLMTPSYIYKWSQTKLISSKSCLRVLDDQRIPT